MGALFLYMDISEQGISATICDASTEKLVPVNGQTVFYNELSSIEQGESEFEAAMAQIALLLDLSSCQEAIVMLPTARFFFRSLQLPFKSKSKIKQVLPLELGQTFPVDNAPFLSDFFVLNSFSDQAVKSVFSASLNEDEFKSYYDCLLGHGIRPVVITAKGVVSPACFLTTCKDEMNCLFLDMAEDEITLSVIVESQIAHIRTFQVNAVSPEFLADELNRVIMGFRQVHNCDKEFHIYTAMLENEDPLYHEIFNSLQNTLEYQQNFKPESLSASSDSRKVLEKKILERDALLSKLTPKRENRYLFNLCMGKYGSEPFFKTHASKLAVSGGLAILVFILFMSQIFSQVTDLEEKVAVKNEIKKSIFKESFPDKKIGQIDPLQHMTSLIKGIKKKHGRSKNGDVLSGQRMVTAVEVITTLSKLIPENVDVELSRLMLDSEKLIISGSTGNFNLVDQIKGFIEKSQMFKKVEISSATASKRTKRVDFKFIIEMAL